MYGMDVLDRFWARQKKRHPEGCRWLGLRLRLTQGPSFGLAGIIVAGEIEHDRHPHGGEDDSEGPPPRKVGDPCEGGIVLPRIPDVHGGQKDGPEHGVGKIVKDGGAEGDQLGNDGDEVLH